MRKFGSLSVAILAVFAMSSTVNAQGPGRGFGGFGQGAYLLLGNKGVQKELKLSDETSEKVTKLVEEWRGKIRDKMEGLSQEERREKGLAISKEINDEAKTATKDLLSAEQHARLEQISLQQRGLQAFADAHVQEKLKLSDEQKDKIKEIGEGVRTQVADLRSAFQSDREGAMQKLAAIRKESFEKVHALLSDDQKKAWKELTGEPYEVKFEGRRPGA